MQKGRLGECYNIGGINEWANIDIVNLVCELMNEQFKNNKDLVVKYPKATKAAAGQSQELITFVTDRAGHDQRYAINPTKSNQELDYSPEESFETGIRKTVEWYLNNQSFWKPLLKAEVV